MTTTNNKPEMDLAKAREIVGRCRFCNAELGGCASLAHAEMRGQIKGFEAGQIAMRERAAKVVDLYRGENYSDQKIRSIPITGDTDAQ